MCGGEGEEGRESQSIFDGPCSGRRVVTTNGEAAGRYSVKNGYPLFMAQRGNLRITYKYAGVVEERIDQE